MSPKKKYKDYESALERLEEITELLESGENSLEESIKLYTEGMDIAKFCNSRLTDAEKKIKIIIEQNDKFTEEEFKEDDEE
jgi:exodeoxyribonuclease VII small subunit